MVFHGKILEINSAFQATAVYPSLTACMQLIHQQKLYGIAIESKVYEINLLT